MLILAVFYASDEVLTPGLRLRPPFKAFRFLALFHLMSDHNHVTLIELYLLDVLVYMV